MPVTETSGRGYEAAVEHALRRAGYWPRSQVSVGDPLDTGCQVIDFAVPDDAGHQLLVSVKGQDSRGTVEEKLVYEVVRLVATLQNPSAERWDGAWVVLCGSGYSPRFKRFLMSDTLRRIVKGSDRIRVVDLNDFHGVLHAGRFFKELVR